MIKFVRLPFLLNLLALALVSSLWAQTSVPTSPASPAAAQPATPAAKPDVKPGAPEDEKKHTSLGLYLSAKEAYEMWQKDPEKIKILDWRTSEEYAYVGHSTLGINIPSKFMSYRWDPEKKNMS